MKKSLQNKIDHILVRDYSTARIKEGQEWYVGHGIFMDSSDTKEHLLDQMDIIKGIIKSAESLQKCIEDQFTEYRDTRNLYSAVLDLGERLSLIEGCANQYVKLFSELQRNENKARTAYYDEDLSF